MSYVSINVSNSFIDWSLGPLNLIQLPMPMKSILVGLQSGILMAKESDKKEGDNVYDSLNGELLYKHKKKQKVTY